MLTGNKNMYIGTVHKLFPHQLQIFDNFKLQSQYVFWTSVRLSLLRRLLSTSSDIHLMLL